MTSADAEHFNLSAELVEALHAGDEETIRSALQAQAVPSYPLHYAARMGLTQAVKTLIESGVAVDARHQRDGTTALHEAACTGQQVVVKCLLERGANPHTQSGLEPASFGDHGNPWVEKGTPLFYACEGHHLAVAQLLLQAGARVDGRGDDLPDVSPSPLFAAINFSGGGVEREEVVLLLLEAGAHPNQRDPDGRSALVAAAETARLPLLKLLLTHGAKPNAQDELGQTPLEILAQRNALTTEIAEAFAQHGSIPINLAARAGATSLLKAKVRTRASANKTDKKGRTLIQLAALSGNEAAVRFLLGKGADPKQPDASGATLLAYAGIGGIESLFQEQLAHALGSELDAAAVCTTKHGNAVALECILDRGADTHTIDKDNECLLALAPNAEIARMLLQRGADIDSIKFFENRLEHDQFPADVAEIFREVLRKRQQEDPEQRLWALWRALRKCNTKAALDLLEHGVPLDRLEPKSGQTVIAFSIGQVLTQLLPQLIVRGADPNARCSNSWTALHFAHAYGQHEAIGLLVEAGADPAATDREGRTPKQVANTL